MKEFTYRTKGTCSRAIELRIRDDGIVEDVRIVGGCQGNTRGLTALAVGRPAKELVELLRGIDCNGRGTSCPDQLARAITAALEEI